MKEVSGKLMLGVAFFTCPCHLPIYAALFAGTAMGSFFTENLGLALVLLTASFALSLRYGLRMVKAQNTGGDGENTP